MSMANSIQIKYHGEVLCCLDQTEVKAVEPYVFCKPPPRNVFKRIAGCLYSFVTGRKMPIIDPVVDIGTKILFKDGTWMRLKMPFTEYVDAYC